MSLLQNIKQLDGIQVAKDKDERVIRDNQWVEGINRGETDAFESIYKCYYPQLFYFLKRYLVSDSTIEDIIHNVFFNIWQKRTTLEPRGTLKSYLFTAVRNQALTQLESEKKYERIAEEIEYHFDDEERDTSHPFEIDKLREAYQKAVQEMPKKRRHIFLMHRQENLTYKEISEILNISIKTVETQMSRSLKFLAESLSNFR